MPGRSCGSPTSWGAAGPISRSWWSRAGGTQGTLAACGLGRDEPVNVQIMPHTTDPRRFYALTRIALMPSLCPENQPLVAVEAMINGIPVIGSDRGGIPEALGDCGFVLPLPERLTPDRPGRAGGRGGRAVGRGDHAAVG